MTNYNKMQALLVESGMQIKIASLLKELLF